MVTKLVDKNKNIQFSAKQEQQEVIGLLSQAVDEIESERKLFKKSFETQMERMSKEMDELSEKMEKLKKEIKFVAEKTSTNQTDC